MAPQLAPNCTVPTLGGQPIRITSHAIDRFQERMSRGASRQAAFGGIRELLAYGMVRTTPRWWTPGRAPVLGFGLCTRTSTWTSAWSLRMTRWRRS